MTNRDHDILADLIFAAPLIAAIIFIIALFIRWA